MNTRKKAAASTDRRGAIVPLVAIMLVGILGLAALSVDAGNLYRERRNTQTAADAAADAAAIELLNKYVLFRGLDGDGEARSAALALAAAHGYEADDVTINIPPKTGPFTRQRGYVEVIIKTHPPRFFSAIFSDSEQIVSSRAVAAGTMISTKASVLILDPKAKNSLRLKSRSSSLQVGGDIIVNSNNKRAVNVNKKGQVIADHMLVTGGLAKNSKRNIDADVKTGVAPTADPWAGLPRPTQGPTLDSDDFRNSVNGTDVYELQPGTYKELKFSKNDIVRMAPGVYHVADGSVELKGQASLQANEVTIYNAGKRGFKFATQGEVRITPPKSGIYKGISLFQDSIKKTKVEFKKQSSLRISGIVYAPNSVVQFMRSDLDLGADEDEDWELDDEPMEPDYGSSEAASIDAAIVAGKLSISNNTHVTIKGQDIGAVRPLLGVVE